jgi:hypothetical protein
MSMPFHVKPFQKKVFEEVNFLLKYYQNPPSSQVMKYRKQERKSIERKKRKKKKEKGKIGRKRKVSRVTSNKEEVNILSGEKHFNFKNLFLCDFPPLHHTISKTLSKNH